MNLASVVVMQVVKWWAAVGKSDWGRTTDTGNRGWSWFASVAVMAESRRVAEVKWWIAVGKERLGQDKRHRGWRRHWGLRVWQ